MKRALLFLSILFEAYANAQTYNIGDLIEFPDKTFGVVFYLNQQIGDGLAVSMDEIETQWEAADSSSNNLVRNTPLQPDGALCMVRDGTCPVQQSFTTCFSWSMPAVATADRSRP